VRGESEGESDSASASGFRMLIQAAGIGGLFKFLESGIGLLSGNIAATAAWLKGQYLFMGSITLSPALIGVGYIVGFNIAMLVFLGGVIGTVIGVPLNWMLNSEVLLVAIGLDASTPFSALTADNWGDLAAESWQNCRRIGVGAMMVGGLWSLISLCKPIYRGMKSSLAVYRAASSGQGGAPGSTSLSSIWYFGVLVPAEAG
ncbi:MAG: OPT/YSL family transporter, partial [Planctomycetes bacterium]|nr:OPT/YSL family transporter [Planctomycetota bacterium]